MTRYRVHYVRYSPHAAGLDSAQALRLYELDSGIFWECELFTGWRRLD